MNNTNCNKCQHFYVTYKPKFPFYLIGEKFVNSKFNKNMTAALNRALKSVR